MSYPIKYAVEKLRIDGGITHDYEEIIVGYIVSKCYVLERRFNYCNERETYVVSFPFDDFDSFIIWYRKNSHNYNFDIYKHYYEQRRNPSRELIRDESPRHIVDELFDTYIGAKEVADSKNGCLKGKILTNAGSVAYEKLSKEFEQTMDICGEYEKFIFSNTTDMNVPLIETEYANYQDSVVLAKLLEEFGYDPIKAREIITKYKNLTLEEKGELLRKKFEIVEKQIDHLKKIKKIDLP